MDLVKSGVLYLSSLKKGRIYRGRGEVGVR
jgi:hypothetical protein